MCNAASFPLFQRSGRAWTRTGVQLAGLARSRLSFPLLCSSLSLSSFPSLGFNFAAGSPPPSSSSPWRLRSLQNAPTFFFFVCSEVTVSVFSTLADVVYDSVALLFSSYCACVHFSISAAIALAPPSLSRFRFFFLTVFFLRFPPPQVTATATAETAHECSGSGRHGEDGALRPPLLSPHEQGGEGELEGVWKAGGFTRLYLLFVSLLPQGGR